LLGEFQLNCLLISSFIWNFSSREYGMRGDMMAFSDEQIKKTVIDQLYWDARVDVSEVKVEVSDGNVIVTGTVPSYGARQAAETDTFIIEGVLSVKNDLQVKFAPGVTIPTDEALRANIETLLELHPNIDNTDIAVSANKGHVTLEGSVKTYWEKMSAQDLVAITNILAVVPSEKIVDQVIADDIISALDRNPVVDAQDVDVKAENGIVTFTGTVPSPAASRAATTIGWYTKGGPRCGKQSRCNPKN
jgi:hyperosmotically inducible protein